MKQIVFSVSNHDCYCEWIISSEPNFISKDTERLKYIFKMMYNFDDRYCDWSYWKVKVRG